MAAIRRWRVVKGAVRPQALRAAKVDMPDLLLGQAGVPVDKNADAARRSAGRGHFDRAEQRRLLPAYLAGGGGRVGAGQVGREGEDRAGDICFLNAVGGDQRLQQFARRPVNGLRGVGVGLCCAAHAPASPGEIGHSASHPSCRVQTTKKAQGR